MYAMLLAAAVSSAAAAVTASAEPLRVVTTLSTYASLAETIGGDRVEVSYVAPPRFNPHFIEARPSDVLKVKRADLFIHGGLDLEVWRGPLLDAAGNPAVRPGGRRELPMAAGIRLLHVPESLSRAGGDIHQFGNPHYWVDPRNGHIMAESIARKLAELDPDHAGLFEANLSVFRAELGEKIRDWQLRLAPLKGREVIAYHDEWPYLLDFAGLQAEVFLEPKPGIPPTPRHLQYVESYIREHKVSSILMATYSPDRAARRLADRTGVSLVKLCQNVGEVPEAADYLSMTDYNLRQLLEAVP